MGDGSAQHIFDPGDFDLWPWHSDSSERGTKQVFPVNLTQICSAVPEIFDSRTNKEKTKSHSAKNRTLLACSKYRKELKTKIDMAQKTRSLMVMRLVQFHLLYFLGVNKIAQKVMGRFSSCIIRPHCSTTLWVKKGCHHNHGYNFVSSWWICKILSMPQRAQNFQQSPY